MKNINEETLMLYLDGKLTPTEQQLLEEALQHDAHLREQLSWLEASQLPYKTAFEEVTQPPVPEDTKDWVNNLCKQQVQSQYQSKTMYLGGIAVFFCIGLFFGYGFALNKDKQNTLDWVTPIAQYQSLYVKETIEPLAFNPSLTNGVLEQVKNRYGLELSIPDLTQLGKDFKRIQFLEMEGQPVLQLVYKDEQGLPLALCVVINRDAFSEEIAPSLTNHKHIKSLTWQANHTGITLLGKQPAQELQAIERQLSQTSPWFVWNS